MKHSSDLAVIIHPARPDWSTRLNVAPQALPHFWRSWLLERGSLTARLSSLKPGCFSVDCQSEGIGYPTPTEQKELGLSASQRVWFREVQLKLNGTPVVHARTVVPAAALTGRLSRLRQLGNRSLGSFLFSQPDMRRTFVRVSHCKANAAGLEWARRSVFTLGGRSLMVTEAFSPSLTEFDLTDRTH